MVMNTPKSDWFISTTHDTKIEEYSKENFKVQFLEREEKEQINKWIEFQMNNCLEGHEQMECAYIYIYIYIYKHTRI